MKKRFLIECSAVMDSIDSIDNPEKNEAPPLFSQLRIWFHLLLCPSCAAELKKLRRVEAIMRTDFLPVSPEFEEAVMKRLRYEEDLAPEEPGAPAGFSLRGWVVIGFFLLLSLPSSFFGVNFVKIANSEGLSFLLPVGITIGMVVTCYGALFIGSHLKELSSRFGLR